jgi:hypothetical protein
VEALREVVLDGLLAAGVFAALITAARVVGPLGGEAAEWTGWLAAGVIVPLTVGWIARGRVPAPLRHALVIVAVGAVSWYVILTQRWIALPLGVAQVWLTAWFRREPVRPLDVLVAIGAWAAVGALGRTSWEPRAEHLADYLLRRDPASIAATIAVFVSVVGSLALHGHPAASFIRNRWRWLAATSALAVIALESLRVDYLFDPISIHHWGVFTGPAEAVRQGGWLLWDTPSTYGFLSTLAIAALPTQSVWDGFLLLNAVACSVSAGVLFWLLRQHMNALVALLLSLAAVLWLPGVRVFDHGGGVLVTPNAGPFRFVWCHVLLAIAALRRPPPLVLAVGTVVWLAGSLWSSEGAVYCSATWLPAYALHICRQPRTAWWRWLALPPLLGLGAAAVIFGYYWMHLGHGPDWYAFVEAAIAVRGGVVALPIDPLGAVAVLVLVGWALAAVAAVTLRTARGLHSAAPLCAAFGLLWATSSYFVGRSHEVIVTSLLPSCCLVAALLLRERYAAEETGARAAMTAFFAGLLLLAMHEPSGWWPRRPLGQRWALAVEELRPVMSAEFLELMQRAGIGPGTPLVFYNQDVLAAWPFVDGVRAPDVSWLPVTPFTEIVPVAPERRGLYIARFADRTRMGGWLIGDGRVRGVNGGGRWFFQALNQRFVRAREEQVGRWRATRYDYRAGSTALPSLPTAPQSRPP